MNSLEKFNTQALEFLSKMIATFPHEQKIKQYKFGFEQLQKFDAKKPVELFMHNLEHHGFEIMTKDEHFFKQDQYVKAAESFSESLGLVEIWDSIPESTKDNIWSYIQTLYVFGMKTLGKDDELRNIIMQIKSNNQNK